MPHIEYGTANNGVVNFKNEFSEIPIVVISMKNSNSDLLFSVHVTSVSKSGFNYIVRYNSIGGNTWTEYNIGLNYIAIGK